MLNVELLPHCQQLDLLKLKQQLFAAKPSRHVDSIRASVVSSTFIVPEESFDPQRYALGLHVSADPFLTPLIRHLSTLAVHNSGSVTSLVPRFADGGSSLSVEFPRPAPTTLPILEDELLWIMPSYIDEPSGSYFLAPVWFEWDSSMGLRHTNSSELKELIVGALAAPLLPEFSEVCIGLNFSLRAPLTCLYIAENHLRASIQPKPRVLSWNQPASTACPGAAQSESCR
jgi:hypothetical protein